MDFDRTLSRILGEIEMTLSEITDARFEVVLEEILRADRVFLFGMGRTALIMKAFAMRLMHLGLKTHVVGDVTTPSIGDRDLLLVGTESGETPSVVLVCKKARESGSRIVSFTKNRVSSVVSLSDEVLFIVMDSEAQKDRTGSIQPMGNVFQQSLLILTDILVKVLKDRLGISSKEMFKNHANLE